MTKTDERRQRLKEALISAAERAVETHGLGGLTARGLASEVGCAVGAIYNVVTDLDDLVIEVNSRTLAALDRKLAAADPISERAERSTPIDRLVRLEPRISTLRQLTSPAVALYSNTVCLRESACPKNYLDEQRRLFRYIEEPVGELQPHLSEERRVLVARSLFSAVHGIVMLGLEEKLHVPPKTLREQVAFIVSAIGDGMLAKAGREKT